MKEKVKRVILIFFCFLNILSLSGCYNNDVKRMSNYGFYIKWEFPRIIDKNEKTKFKLYYGHDCDYSFDDESAYLNVIFEFKLSIITLDDDDRRDEKIVIFIKRLTSDYLEDQSNRAEINGPWIWSKVTLKKYYEVEFAFSDYNYESGLLSYEFSLNDINNTESNELPMEITTFFRANQSTVYFYD